MAPAHGTLPGMLSEHKRLAPLDGGHDTASTIKVIGEALDWLDLYLGSIDSRARSVVDSGD